MSEITVDEGSPSTIQGNLLSVQEVHNVAQGHAGAHREVDEVVAGDGGVVQGVAVHQGPRGVLTLPGKMIEICSFQVHHYRVY